MNPASKSDTDFLMLYSVVNATVICVHQKKDKTAKRF